MQFTTKRSESTPNRDMEMKATQDNQARLSFHGSILAASLLLKAEVPVKTSHCFSSLVCFVLQVNFQSDCQDAQTFALHKFDY